MAFHLRRLRDNVQESGGLSQAISWNEDKTQKAVEGYVPKIGCSILVGSVTARTYADRDYWLTTPVVEILEEIENEDTHYIRFMTENSEYEWWNGKHPKTD